MEADALTVRAPKFVLVPFLRTLSRKGSELSAADIEQPHSIRQAAVFMAKQNEIRILWVKMYVIDPEIFLA